MDVVNVFVSLNVRSMKTSQQSVLGSTTGDSSLLRELQTIADPQTQFPDNIPTFVRERSHDKKNVDVPLFVQMLLPQVTTDVFCLVNME